MLFGSTRSRQCYSNCVIYHREAHIGGEDVFNIFWLNAKPESDGVDEGMGRKAQVVTDEWGRKKTSELG